LEDDRISLQQDVKQAAARVQGKVCTERKFASLVIKSVVNNSAQIGTVTFRIDWID
jgi:ferredoxin-thioredoxin reductase catalytic subunit